MSSQNQEPISSDSQKVSGEVNSDCDNPAFKQLNQNMQSYGTLKTSPMYYGINFHLARYHQMYLQVGQLHIKTKITTAII